jgi:histidinol-phosphatase (PHP family)
MSHAMTIDTDFHSHVAKSSAYEMIQSAQKKGIHVLGLSEHVFQMNEARPLLQHLPQEGPMLTFPTYAEQVHAAAQDLQFDARLGVEVDFIPGKNEQIQSFVQAHHLWDFLIGSVHEINGEVFEVNRKLSREEGEALWLHYFELLRGAVNSGYFSFVSHPVRMRVQNPHLPPTFDDQLEQLAADATRCNTALELNGLDVLTYPSLVRRLARACVLHRTPVSVGSDAHYPRQVAQAHQQTEALMREVGITSVRTWRQLEIEEYSL